MNISQINKTQLYKRYCFEYFIEITKNIYIYIYRIRGMTDDGRESLVERWIEGRGLKRVVVITRSGVI